MLRFAWLVASVLAFMALLAAPAAADVDGECYALAHLLESELSGCYSSSCAAPYAADLSREASVCITAAENHYEAGYGLQGYEADRQLLGACAFEAFAAFGNLFSKPHLSISQLKSIISLLTQIKNDPYAGDLAGVASKALKDAKDLLQRGERVLK